MSSRLPQFVDPWRLAEAGKTLAARVAVTELPRLAAAVLEPAGEVEFTLTFDRDAQGRARVHGTVRAQLMLECQRCLGPLAFRVDARLNLALVAVAEEIDRLPDTYDPWLIEEPRVRLLDIVEDELLLALPQVSRHEAGQCQPCAPAQSAPQPEAAPDEQQKRPNPFAALAGLKDKLN